MNLTLLFLLLFAICLKVFPPKKENYFYGYQLGNARNSVQHWKIANSYASNYMIVIYGFSLGLSLLFDYLKFDGGLTILVPLFVGYIVMYIQIEKRLKRIK